LRSTGTSKTVKWKQIPAMVGTRELDTKGIGRKISRGPTKKDRKIAKKLKIALLSLFQRGGPTKKT